MNVTKLTVKCLGGASLRPRRRDKRGLSSLGRLGRPALREAILTPADVTRACAGTSLDTTPRNRGRSHEGETGSCGDAAGSTRRQGPAGGALPALGVPASLGRPRSLCPRIACVHVRLERALCCCAACGSTTSRLWTHALVYSLPRPPPVDPAVRARVSERISEVFPETRNHLPVGAEPAVPVRTVANYHVF